jgi:sugar/nucleoside kinase (ribokinase family)
MLTNPPPNALDLLVVGALTIDRFADGSSAPGGSVMHIARAAAPRGLRLGLVTAAGPEPVAQSGVDELGRRAALVKVASGTATTTFRHLEAPAGRRLFIEGRGADPHFDAAAPGRSGARAVLFAPVAGEINAQALHLRGAESRRAAILQGWLRTIEPGSEVRPLRLVAIAAALMRALSRLDLLVASREDLLAEADDPATQLLALRRATGTGPTLVVTDGANGLWLSTTSPPAHLHAPWRVDSPSTVGAGDILAAFMLASIADGKPAPTAAEQAMRIVAEVLEERIRG